jgi:nucleotide-binding universal stress UspA family protein
MMTMSQFNRIVVGYDDTEGSNRALQLAVQMAKGNPEAHVLVANVYDEKVENVMTDNEKRVEPVRTNGYMLEGIQIPPMSIRHDDPNPPTHAIISNSVDDAFYKAKQELEPHNIQAKYDSLDGSPAESICDYASAEGADLIIVGNSGKGGLKQMFLGSVSSNIAKQAPCPVLIAK